MSYVSYKLERGLNFGVYIHPPSSPQRSLPSCKRPPHLMLHAYLELGYPTGHQQLLRPCTCRCAQSSQ